MKLLVAGNLVNSGYHLTKLLRNEGFATDLLLKKNPSVTEEPKSLEGGFIELSRMDKILGWFKAELEI